MKKTTGIILLAVITVLGIQLTALAGDNLEIPTDNTAAQTLYTIENGELQPVSVTYEESRSVANIENSPALRSGGEVEIDLDDEEEDAFTDWEYEDMSEVAAIQDAVPIDADLEDDAPNAANNATENVNTGAANATLPLMAALLCAGAAPLLLKRK